MGIFVAFSVRVVSDFNYSQINKAQILRFLTDEKDVTLSKKIYDSIVTISKSGVNKIHLNYTYKS